MLVVIPPCDWLPNAQLTKSEFAALRTWLRLARAISSSPTMMV